MSEDILSVDIELTENVRQKGTVKREHEEETKGGIWSTCVGVTQTWQSYCTERGLVV